MDEAQGVGWFVTRPAEDTVVVFTGRSVDQMLRDGGSCAWRIDTARAKQCTYLVCTRNTRIPDRPRYWGPPGPEKHGSAFLIARLNGVEPSPAPPEPPGRFTLTFSEYALVDVPRIWGGWQYPVHFASLAELGFSPQRLAWQTAK